MSKTNKDKTPEIDETILEETPPNINEPQNKEGEEEPEETPEVPEQIPEVPTEPEEDNKEQEDEDKEEEPIVETPEEKRHKAQQTEAQILAARNRALMDKVDEASKLPEPTLDELKAFVAQDGVEWDDLTTFEQSMAKKSYLNEKRFSLVNESVQVTKRIDEWAKKVDEFIDSTDGKSEFAKLNGHEMEFRAFCMKESHRGSPIDSLLLPAFLQNLPKAPKKRGSLFESQGGGEKPETPAGVITDTDQITQLRQNNPREYRRLIKTGRIKSEV